MKSIKSPKEDGTRSGIEPVSIIRTRLLDIKRWPEMYDRAHEWVFKKNFVDKQVDSVLFLFL